MKRWESDGASSFSIEGLVAKWVTGGTVSTWKTGKNLHQILQSMLVMDSLGKWWTKIWDDESVGGDQEQGWMGHKKWG